MNYEKEEDIEKTSTSYYAWDEPCKADRKLTLQLEVKGSNSYKVTNHPLKPDMIGLFKIFTLKAPNQPTLFVALTIKPEGYQK